VIHLLTNAEKKTFRTMPCGRCGALPPYSDGSWTQKHRIIPGGKKGGQYTKENTVPRCPPCHNAEHNGRQGFIMLSQEKRCAAARNSVAVRKGKPPWNKGKSCSSETREKISAAQRGRLRGKHHSMSGETRAKLSAANRGQVPWNKGKTGIYSPGRLAQLSRQVPWNKGKHLSPEYRAKISAGMKAAVA
jgi:NUMOD3 motif/HNH endonuclease